MHEHFIVHELSESPFVEWYAVTSLHGAKMISVCELLCVHRVHTFVPLIVVLVQPSLCISLAALHHMYIGVS